MEEYLRAIRGTTLRRLITEQSTYSQLHQNTLGFAPVTKKRQHSVDPIHIETMTLTPMKKSGKVLIRSSVRSGNSGYFTQIQFSDVEYEDDNASNVSFKGTDNEDHHIQTIDLGKSEVKVRCNCMDFKYRFSPYNNKDKSLLWKAFSPYIKKTNRPDASLKKQPGVCKHIIALVSELKRQRIVR